MEHRQIVIGNKGPQVVFGVEVHIHRCKEDPLNGVGDKSDNPFGISASIGQHRLGVLTERADLVGDEDEHING